MRGHLELFGPAPPPGRMVVGFAIGEGWRAILIDLLAELQVIVRREELTTFRIEQVKQKLGGLRVYVRPFLPEVRQAIDRAEERAAATCEFCGRPGKLRMGPYIQTLCDKHAANHP